MTAPGLRRSLAYSRYRIVTTALLAVALGACATHDGAEDALMSRQQASTAVSLLAFQQAMAAGATVAGASAVYLGDRVTVKTASGGWAAVSNTGTVLTQVGTDAKVGPIWSNARIDLRDRAIVFGAAKAPTFTVGNGVVVQGGMSTGPRGPTVDLLEAFDDLPLRQSTPILVETGQQRGLEPGKYGSVTVRAQGTLLLDPGAYSFSTILVEQGGKVVTKSDCNPVNVQARTGFTFRGTALESGGNDPGVGLVVRYDGAATGFIEQPFRGVVLAPLAELNLSAHAHEGRFFAKVVRAQAGATITDAAPPTPVAGECGVGVELGTPGTSVDIGPAPALTTADDLDDFLPWYFKITNAEKAAAEERIGGVLEDSGIRQDVIARFEEAREARNFGDALMLLAFLGRLEDLLVRPFFIDLVGDPITAPEDPQREATTRFDEEVSYRRQALFILRAIDAPETVAAVKVVAVESPVVALRSAAIHALRKGLTATAIESLRDDLRPEDGFYLDMPSRSDPEFNAKMAAFRAKYSQD